jgi:dynein heavy chain, axonemal
VASPATVSRAGMIYLDIEEIGWRPQINSWIRKKKEAGWNEDYITMLTECAYERYLDKVLTIKQTACREMVKTSEAACVRNFISLYDCLMSRFEPTKGEDREAYLQYCEKWFVFALIWSVGCTVEADTRREIDAVIRDQGPMFPMSETVFEYFINQERKDYAMWAEKIPKDEIKLMKNKKFHEIQV